MSRFLQFSVHIRDTTIVVPVLWSTVFVALTVASGWSVADYVVDSAETFARVVFAGALLAATILALAIHEAGHSIWSRGRHEFVRYLAVYWPGSMPSSYYTPETPGREIRHAAMGPFVSSVVGAMFLGLAFLIGLDGSPGKIVSGFAIVNLAFAALNLVPALPFDGGRVLRAVFWYLNDRHVSGSRVAFLYSQLVASFGLAFGVFVLAWREEALLLGFWLVTLSWLCIRTSRTELLRSNLIERANRVRASDAVHGLNPTIRARASVSEAVDILLEQKENGPALVRDRDRFVGMLTLNEVLQIPRTEWPDREVSDIMRAIDGLQETAPDAPLLEVLRAQHRTAPLPVVVRASNGEITGLIDHEMAPRLLLRRAEERSFDLAKPRSGQDVPDRS